MALTIFSSNGAELSEFDPLNQPSQDSRVSESVLIDIQRIGKNTIAVGEQGGIILSNNDGKSWQQAIVPVSVTFTSVFFISDLKGWAVGHSGVVVHTEDGGLTWNLQLDDSKLSGIVSESGSMPIEAGDPFLDVIFFDEFNGYVIGAFGLILRTFDGGESWNAWHEVLPNPEGNHLYGIKNIDGRLIIVGERGSIFISTNQGDSFNKIESPYEGSYFGVEKSGENQFIVFGLRGHIFHTHDFGITWNKVDVDTDNAWTGAAYLGNRKVVIVNQGGELAVSHDAGKTFSISPTKFPPLSSVSQSKDSTILMTGMRGINNFTLVEKDYSVSQ